MNNIHSEVFNLKTAIDALLVSFPELAEDEVLRADMLEAETDLNTVIEHLLSLLLDAESMMTAISIRVKEMNIRGARYERRKDAMRSLIQSLMERAGMTKMTMPEATLSTSYRKPTPVILNDEEVPDELCKLKRIPDLKKIAAAVEAGQMPSGVSMSNGRSILTIRRA